MTIKRVVTYLRVSTVGQIENTSIEYQREKIGLYCKFNDIEIINEFKDEAKSAKNDNREEYKEMLEFIKDKSNQIDAVVVLKSDRIHRSLRNLMNMISLLQENDIQFISVTENFDTSNAQGILFLQMLGSFSEFERKMIAERTRSGRITNANNKIHPGGRVPYGYKLKDGKLVIVKEQADIIKKIFNMRSKGNKLIEISKDVGMSKQRISKILKNKIYVGEFNYNGKVENNNIKLQVEGIISKYIFNKINKGEVVWI